LSERNGRDLHHSYETLPTRRKMSSTKKGPSILPSEKRGNIINSLLQEDDRGEMYGGATPSKKRKRSGPRQRKSKAGRKATCQGRRPSKRRKGERGSNRGGGGKRSDLTHNGVRDVWQQKEAVGGDYGNSCTARKGKEAVAIKTIFP